ncbi:MAG: hypothetical protein B7Y45_03605 [Sphingomonas sp. 28-66-16]|nr:MAG: hypothetical protein B7Y45_03605 [Sphingomonas sp. 28-66-16]
MPLPAPIARQLPSPLPDDPNARLCLLGIRRFGAHGLDDAVVTHQFLRAFGGSVQRPLIALRVMMTEVAAAASTPMMIAPCCCPRATAAERAMLDIIVRIPVRPAAARLLLADLLGNRQVDGVFTSVALVASAFADAGRPIR